jgi:hypothetical protein
VRTRLRGQVLKGLKTMEIDDVDLHRVPGAHPTTSENRNHE